MATKLRQVDTSRKGNGAQFDFEQKRTTGQSFFQINPDMKKWRQNPWGSRFLGRFLRGGLKPFDTPYPLRLEDVFLMLLKGRREQVRPIPLCHVI
jgi:hypothetical protein